MINSNLSHFRDMATDSLKLSIAQCVMTLQGHPKSSIYMTFENQYATFYQ